MNPHLQTLLDSLQRSETLSAEDKNAFLASLKAIDKEWELTAFKLDRTEKVKRTTAILLEETIQELEQKRKAVEAQNRELEIEGALEKVRTIATGMKEPAHMLDVCKTMSFQLQSLGVNEIRNVQTAIFYEQRGTYMNYEYYAKHEETFVTETTFTNHEIHSAFATQMLKGKGETFITHIQGDEVEDWIAYQKKTNVFIDKYLATASSLNYYWFSLGPVALGISTYRPLSEEDIDLFKRFVKVFELAYWRYLDIERAGAQAREAHIEASLERVRSRSMAMHHTSELQDVINTVHQQFTALNIAATGGAFVAINEDNAKELTIWGAGGVTDYAECVQFPFFDRPIYTGLIAGMKNGPGLFTEEFSHEEKIDFFNHLFQHPPFSNASPERKTELLSRPGGYTRSCCVSKYTTVFVINHHGEKFSEEENRVLTRFGNVFEQTYTRFLDLQKAEAQARESQIELALERIRARTMAMQKSDELPEAANLLFQQVRSLGMPAWSAGYNIWDEDKNGITAWMSSEGVLQPPFKAPTTEDELFIQMQKGYDQGKTFHVVEMGGEELVKHYQYAGTLPVVGDIIQSIKAAGYPLPTFQIMHLAYFSKGFLMFITYEPVPEAHDIFKRFASVFEQTYTRFLDLQRAEAQARESQIQLALERVRARTMAMQNSDELREAVLVIYEQLQQLNVDAKACNIIILDKETNNAQYWVSGFSQEIFPESYQVPYLDHPYHHALIDPWKQGEKYVVYNYAGKMKQDFDEIFFTQTEFRNVPEEAKNVMMGIESVMLSTAFFSYGALQVLGAEPLSEEDAAILQRFAIVFEQTYIRFLDLQKAEAQAREAQIELSLEKIRAKATAMKVSSDLLDIVVTMRSEFVALGHEAHYFWHMRWLPDKYEKAMTSGDGTRIGMVMELPRGFHEDERMIAWEATREPVGIFTYDAEGAVAYVDKMVRTGRFQEIDPNAPGPDDLRAIGGLTFVMARTTHGEIGYSLPGIVANPPDEDLATLVRCAGVFDLAYRRFEDLKNAERQHREAQIDLALERVRARTMAMQSSGELSETAFLMAHQIRGLGIKAWGCAFHIYADNAEGDYEWFSNEKGYLPFYKTPRENFFKRFYDKRQSGETLYVEEFKGTTCAAHYDYMMSLPVVGEALKGLKESGVPLPPSQIDHVAYFSHGYLLFITYEPAPEAHGIFKRFSREFEQTYTRFLDLKNSEALAREARIEAALERVRSRSMGMQTSEDLKEVIQVVYDQFVHLGIGVEHTGFILDYRERDDMHIWLADKHKVPSEIAIPYFDSPHWNSFLDAKEKGLDFFANQLGFEEKNRFYRDLFKHFFVPDDAQQYYFSCPGLAISTVLLESVGLYIENFSGIPYTDEENATLMRFGRVFQQTYTRFKDLKKAEAQAKEAQIEAALERVRSKAMTMYTTHDLSATVSTFFKELRSLNVLPWRCGVGQIDEETKTTFLTTTSNTINGQSSEVRGTLHQEGHPVLDGIFEHWKLQREFSPVLQGDDIRRYYEIIRPQIAYPEYPLDAMQFGHFFFIREGFVFAWTENQLSEGELEIFRRFASVLSLTYRRYLDLKEAEEQNRIIQADNERKTRELEEARQLQLSMLPKHLPTLPHLDIAVYMKTSSEVGGDYYDFSVDDDGTLTAAIGDATGHGMKAGTIVSMIKTLFASSGARMDMKTFFTQSSDTLKGLELGRLMMAFIMLKIRADKMEFANAGMPPLFIYREGSKVVEEIMIHGMPLGAMKRFPYDIRELDISPGDTILLLSDGLPELRNRNNEQYGYERVKQEFMVSAERSSSEIVEYLKHSALEWSSGTEPDDDVTFVVIKGKMH